MALVATSNPPFAAALLPLLEEKRTAISFDKALSDYRDARRGWTTRQTERQNPIHPQYLAQQISHFAGTMPYLPATWARQPSGRHAI